MKHIIIYLLPFVFGLWCCNKQTKNITIKDKSQYDQIFIERLKTHNGSLTLVDNTIISGDDTANFPEYIPLNKRTIFKGNNRKYSVLLSLRRINYTNLKYDFQVIDSNNKVFASKTGTAIISNVFSDVPDWIEDDQTGEYCESQDYWDTSGTCWACLNIGVDKNGNLKANLSYGCDDTKMTLIHLDQCPTLRTQ